MLTYQCKVILKKLKQLTDDTEREIAFLGDTTLFCLSNNYDRTCDYSKYKNEIHSIISHLVSNGYLCYGSNEYCFSLTHKGVHKSVFYLHKVWLTILTSIILPSIVALITTLITLLLNGLL